MKKAQIETEEVTVRIPKKLLTFLRKRRNKDLKEYLSDCLTDSVSADIDAGAYGNPDTIINDYTMNKEFQLYRSHSA